MAGGGGRDLHQTVVVELVVAGERDQAAPAGRQREEDLHGRVPPHLAITQRNQTAKVKVTYKLAYRCSKFNFLLFAYLSRYYFNADFFFFAFADPL